MPMFNVILSYSHGQRSICHPFFITNILSSKRTTAFFADCRNYDKRQISQISCLHQTQNNVKRKLLSIKTVHDIPCAAIYLEKIALN